MNLQQIMKAFPENKARVVACAMELTHLSYDDLARPDYQAAMQAFALLEVADQLRVQAEFVRWKSGGRV